MKKEKTSFNDKLKKITESILVRLQLLKLWFLKNISVFIKLIIVIGVILVLCGIADNTIPIIGEISDEVKKIVTTNSWQIIVKCLGTVASIAISVYTFTKKTKRLVIEDIKSKKLKIALIKANLYFDENGRLRKRPKTEKVDFEDTYDIVVVGAGHAGCEASLACARLGFETICFTVSMDSVALMPCNPNIGGSSKGHLVREIDALGGEMGKNIDKTYIQSKMLNGSKGPAVHSLRAQADKQKYTYEMRHVMENTEHLTLKQAEVSEILVEDGKVTGVKTYSGATYHAKAVILCTGTYLKARCIYGDVSTYTGPNGLSSADHLTDSLKALGIEMYRFKTGTPARVDKRSIDFSVMEEQKGDEKIVPFSFTKHMPKIKQANHESVVGLFGLWAEFGRRDALRHTGCNRKMLGLHRATPLYKKYLYSIHKRGGKSRQKNFFVSLYNGWPAESVRAG